MKRLREFGEIAQRPKHSEFGRAMRIGLNKQPKRFRPEISSPELREADKESLLRR
jgi:hypothetical protein